MRADVHALAGAYVLGALSETERTLFARHMARCEACEQEVAELRDTVPWLVMALPTPPHPALKDAVLAEITEVRQRAPNGRILEIERRPRKWPGRRVVAPSVRP